MNHHHARKDRVGRGFTLIELLVTIAIIAILSSLSLAGLAVARQGVKADRTETTIRKIHEALMPHYEQFANRSLPAPNFSLSGQPTLTSIVNKGIGLVAKRRMMTLELPDGWPDLLQATDDSSSAVPQWTPTTYQSGISRRFFQVSQAFTPAQITGFGQTYGDSECLWMSVMQAGYADPSIIGHFREGEFGDRDGDGQREFIDGWGRPIRFLRWAPALVSRYQPAPGTGTTAHDAFDLANVDPYAQATLFPLIYSMGPDGQSDIANRDQPALAQFSYPEVGYDPNFAMRLNNDPNNDPKDQSQRCHLTFSQRSPAITVRLGNYVIPPLNSEPLGKLLSSQPDDVHNHSMSR
jgi:prepilin-type N-terminal cleavage/methylation domain-containing protein